MSGLPRGWAWTSFGEVAQLTDGPFGSNLKTAHYVEDGPRVVRLQNIGEGVFRDERAHITEEHFEKLKKHALQPGDVVIASLGDDAPRACLTPSWLGPAIVKADCIRARPLSGVDAGFLMWMLNSPPMRRQAALTIKGIGRPRLGLGGIRQLRLALPPAAEQRRIFAAIEEHLSRLDAALSQLRASEAPLAKLRMRILDAAVLGAWDMRPFDDVIRELRNGVFVSRPSAEPPGVPIFRISAVRPMALDTNDIRYGAITEESAKGYFVEAGDLLFTRYSGNPAYVGACALVPPLARRTLHPDKLIRVVVDRTRAVPEYLELAFASRTVRREVEARLKTTAGQVGIAGGQLRTVPVPLPPMAEQRRIALEAREAVSAAGALLDAVQRAAARAEVLRRSILARAFRGDLVPQDKGDEPASVLLERAAAERAASSAPTREQRLRTPA